MSEQHEVLTQYFSINITVGRPSGTTDDKKFCDEICDIMLFGKARRPGAGHPVQRLFPY